MDNSESSPSLTAVVVVSLSLHALAAWGMQGGAHAAAPVRREPVRITVREAVKPPPPPELAVEPEPPALAPAIRKTEPVARERAPRSKPERVARQATQVAEPAAKPASEPAPALDFTGVTLTSPSGGFAQIAGNGERMTGPLGSAHTGSRHGSGKGPDGDGKGAAQGAQLVALGSLSRPPRAPALDEALAANYPKNAHDLGLSGEAVVRARILPSGEVATTHVLVASAPEFGKACQRTLAGSHWSAPLDAEGRPVATELSYKCVFEVTH